MSEENKKANVITPEGRLCFDRHLFEQDDKGKFRCAMVIEKSEDIKALKRLCTETAKEKWPKGLPKGLKMPIKMEHNDTETYQFLEGRVLVQGTTGFNIDVINTKNIPLTRDDIKGGDYVRMSVSAFPFDKDGNKGVGLNIQAVLFLKEGEAFFTPRSAASLFGDMIQEDTSVIDSFNTSAEPEEEEEEDDGFNFG